LDHPLITTLLSYGSALCKEYGLHDETELGIEFADAFGHNLRKVGSFYMVHGETMAGGLLVLILSS
jgi:hypothetical protein